jgi:competence protein ComEC
VLWPQRLAPGVAATGDPNERAIVTLVREGPFTALLTADAESPVTLPLVTARIDVLKVAHHGSADPGLPALLERTHPRLAAIEVGRHNSYGHPSPPTLRALQTTVPQVIRTDEDGTVRVTVSHSAMTVRTHS